MLEQVVIESTLPELTYYRGGSDGQPLVLLNALGQGLDPWSRLVDRLLPRRILIWEMRGTTPPYGGRSVDEHADDLAAILGHEKVAACHLVGWCTGPKVALSYYHRGAGSVSSMVFLNAAFKHTGDRPDLSTPYERDLEAICRTVDQRPDAAARVRQVFGLSGFGQAVAGADGAMPPASLIASVRRPFISDSSLVAYARQHLDFWERDSTGNAADVTIPILFIAAEHDEVVSRAAVRDAARRFPTARYEEIAGASHYALFEEADLVATMIENFVRQAVARARS